MDNFYMINNARCGNAPFIPIYCVETENKWQFFKFLVQSFKELPFLYLQLRLTAVDKQTLLC